MFDLVHMTNDQAFLLFSSGHSSHAPVNVSVLCLVFVLCWQDFLQMLLITFPDIERYGNLRLIMFSRFNNAQR